MKGHRVAGYEGAAARASPCVDATGGEARRHSVGEAVPVAGGCSLHRHVAVAGLEAARAAGHDGSRDSGYEYGGKRHRHHYGQAVQPVTPSSLTESESHISPL